MKNFTIAFTLAIMTALSAGAQKLYVKELELPISKKARKYGQYGGSYWNENRDALQTFYTYREHRRSSRSFDMIKTGVDFEVSDPETELLSVSNLEKYHLGIDETITEEDEFEAFNQPMVWFKRVDLGWNAVAFEGKFSPISGDFGFMGYDFEKQSDKYLLMGKEDKSLNMDFVIAEGPIVEKYSSKVLSQGFMGLSSMATYGYVAKGEKAVIGGIMNGRVKIGMNASEDWLRTRYMVGTFDTETMSWFNQEFYDFDYTLTNVAVAKSADEIAVVLRKDSKGTISNNRVSFKNSDYKGLLLMVFDKSGKLKSQTDLISSGINFFPIQGVPKGVPPVVEVTQVDGSFVITAIAYAGKKHNEFNSITTYKVTNGNLDYTVQVTADDLAAAKTIVGEKVKMVIPKGGQPVLDNIYQVDDKLMLFGHTAEGPDFICEIDDASGQLEKVIASATWAPKKTVNIPLGVRGWSKTSARNGDETTYFNYPVSVQQHGDWCYILYRKMNASMTPGSTMSSTSRTDNAVYTKTVKIDEVFAYGKLFMLNLKTGEITEAITIDDEILVGADGMYIGEDGTAFLHGYDGKQYKLTTVKML